MVVVVMAVVVVMMVAVSLVQPKSAWLHSSTEVVQRCKVHLRTQPVSAGWGLKIEFERILLGG